MDKTVSTPSGSLRKYARKSTVSTVGASKSTNIAPKRQLISNITRNVDKDEIKPKKFRQIYFKTSTDKTVCQSCHMSYVPHLKIDNDLHEKFHHRSLTGREWSPTWGHKLYNFTINMQGKTMAAQLVEVDPHNAAEVRALKELLELVNTELQAPDDCGYWLKGKEFGKVFVCVLNKRAIGIICLERVTVGEWLILETGNIVPKQQVPLIVGISRIYVVRNFRRFHVGSELLKCTQRHFLYGSELKKTEIGWSQPSEFGSKLAKNFNSIKHKSGYNLLPIYVEK